MVVLREPSWSSSETPCRLQPLFSRVVASVGKTTCHSEDPLPRLFRARAQGFIVAWA